MAIISIRDTWGKMQHITLQDCVDTLSTYEQASVVPVNNMCAAVASVM